MTNDNNDNASEDQPWKRPDPDDEDFAGRREPAFGRAEDDLEEYEEPDRDAGFGYGADEVVEEDEDFDDLFAGQDDDPQETDTGNTAINPFAEPGQPAPEEPEADTQEDLESWEDEDEEEYYEDEDRSWPMKLVAVAAVAVILIAAGVYGVLQERAATAETIRNLQADMATSVTRAEYQELQASFDALRAEADASSFENTRLRDTIFDLEEELKAAGANQAAAAPTPGSNTETVSQPEPAPEPKPAPVPTPKPEAKPAPTPPKPAATSAPTGPWFVNFGSYTSRDLAADWAAKLRPASGEVIVMPGSRDGKSFYRVRVVGLDSKESADRVARQLEAEQQVSKLWVGQD